MLCKYCLSGVMPVEDGEYYCKECDLTLGKEEVVYSAYIHEDGFVEYNI